MRVYCMSKLPISIPKQPALKPAEDYYRLRRDGIGYIAQMGSRQWTDYNTHDPGITVLEGLCYAITDLAYRVGRDIKDILAPETAPPDKSQPYRDDPRISYQSRKMTPCMRNNCRWLPHR